MKKSRNERRRQHGDHARLDTAEAILSLPLAIGAQATAADLAAESDWIGYNALLQDAYARACALRS